MITLFAFSAAVVGLAMLIMSVGVIFSNRCLRGSCGSAELRGPDGESLSCSACPRRREGGAPAAEQTAFEP